MADGIYVALSGALGRNRQLDVYANNLANLETPGFKASGMAFSAARRQIVEPPPEQPGLADPSPRYVADDKRFLQAAETYVKLEGGSLQETGSPLDLSLDGGAFFQVASPFGAAALPSGSFQVNPRGQVVDGNGAALLLDDGRALTVPQGAALEVSPDGEVLADGAPVGRLAVVRLVGAPRNVGASYLQGPTAPVEAGEVDVMQGWLLSSNVDPLKDLVGMINVQRTFEAMQNVIQTYRQVDRQASQEVGKAGK